MVGQNIDHRLFGNAFFAYARVMHGLEDLKALGVSDLDDGPLQDCPICSNTQGKLSKNISPHAPYSRPV